MDSGECMGDAVCCAQTYKMNLVTAIFDVNCKYIC